MPVLVALLVLSLIFAGYVVFRQTGKPEQAADQQTPTAAGTTVSASPYTRVDQPTWMPAGWAGPEKNTPDKLWLTQPENEGGSCDATVDRLRVRTDADTSGHPLTGCQLKAPMTYRDLTYVAIESQVKVASGCA